jgi:hypothetical protein
MNASTAFLVYTSALAGGEPTFILTCDDSALRWLANSLRELGERRQFTLGDGRPVSSDGQCVIEVVSAPRDTVAAIAQVQSGTLRWSLPLNLAYQFANLIDGMVELPGPCHQYLETAEPNVPVVIVSKGEYDAAKLRQMREP